MLYYLFIYMTAGDWVLLLVVTVDYWVLSLSAVIKGGDRLLGLEGRQMLIRSLVTPTCRVLDCF